MITKEERLGFVRLIKGLTCTLTDLRDYNEAIITKGGIKIKEVDPGTMESKLVKGLHFCRRGTGSGCGNRWIQPSDRVVYGICGRNGDPDIE